MKEQRIKAWIVPDEVEANKNLKGILEISKIILKEPIIYINLADIKEKRELAQPIELLYELPT